MQRHFLAAALMLLPAPLFGQTKPAPTPPEGVMPLGADGQRLNFDFETGTLKDWTAVGDAFVGQPIRGDTVSARRGDNKSQHQGSYWIGGYELRHDKPQGSLTSVPFKVTHPWGSFLVGGGPHVVTCVELVRKDSDQVFLRASGFEEENLRREVVNLKPHLGKEIYIRLVDKHSGHWGHINFDDFRFHAQKPDFAPRLAGKQPLSPPDAVKYAGLSPQKAAEAMTVPEGFTVKLFAGEPDVHQPIAFCLDDRGRLWVAEAYCYPIRRKDKDANDRIVIFEDTDGDGAFDKRTQFMDGLNLVSGLEVGHGGVWIGAAPYFMFVPMKDDKPAGPPQVLLDGWGYQDTHETLNTFTWGPDGWLYGCHGVFTRSEVGKPGAPEGKRTKINAGIWRYHPTKHVFEVFAEGTSNPWGLDFNDHGQAFVEACVIPHCFHIIQGARYNRQAGQHFNPFTFADIATIADHRHYIGATPHGGNLRSDAAGGGHAHCGTMVYLGGAWPREYRDRMFMGNIHGKRLNVDILKPRGSGYVAGHGPDFLLANDAWARFINFRYGPDGNVYLIDWYDKQACHTGNPQIWDRTNGRIYKVSYRGTKPVQVDLGKLSDTELAGLQTHANDWYVRHARRLLQERGAGKSARAALEQLAFVRDDVTVPQRLRGLWALHVTGGLSDELIHKGLKDQTPLIRAWTIQLALENKSADPTLLTLLESLAPSESAQVVRLYLAAGAQRLPLEQRWKIMDGLLAHADDAGDHNLPLMYWYAAEPLGGADPVKALELAARAKLPQVLAFMVRRIGQAGTPEALALLVDGLEKAGDSGAQLTILRGLADALKGRRDLPMPKDWARAYAKLAESQNADVRAQALALAVVFGDTQAFDAMRRLITTPSADLAQRQNALTSLLGARDKQLPPVLFKLLDDSNLRGAALRGLAVYDNPATPKVILDAFPRLTSEEKRDALGTLTARAAYGAELVGAIEAKRLLATDLSADVVRQLRNLGDPVLAKRIADVWGVVRDTPADRAKLIKLARKSLAMPAPVDVALGRAVYVKTCAQCHVLFGTGGKVGPEITGANRQSVDYLLENIFDPSAVIPKEYGATILELEGGRVLTGIVKAETPATLTVMTATETLTLPVRDVVARKVSDKSMMPDDLVKQINEVELRALVAYLQGPAQVPLLATVDNAKDLFNGKDLTGWDGNPKLWRVDNGEIVGQTSGLKRNEFLTSQMLADDFRLTLQVKLVPDKENSGIQFRSTLLPGGEVKGPQADVGAGWWGKLYEEHGRGLLWKAPGDSYVKKDQWNAYTIVASGSRIKTYINGQLCVDLDDAQVSRRGIFAFQLHSGGALEVRYKDIRLEVKPKVP